MPALWRQQLLWASTAFALLLTLLWWWPSFAETLEFDRAAIGHGALWRIFSGNWVHFTAYHWLMNAAGVWLIGVLLWPSDRWQQFCWYLLLLPIAVGVALYGLAPSVDVYRGYSGSLYGLLLAALVLNLRKDPLWFGGGLLVLLGKIGYEQLPVFDPDYLHAQLGASIAHEAHLFGVASAALMLTAQWLFRAARSKRRLG